MKNADEWQGSREMRDDEMQRKMLIMALIAIILGTAVGRFISALAQNAALGFVAVVVFESLFFSLLYLRYLRRR